MIEDAQNPIRRIIDLLVRNGELLVASAFMVVGLFVTIYCWAGLRFMAPYGPGPGFAPILTGAGLAIVSAWRVGGLLLMPSRDEDAADYDTGMVVRTSALIALSFLNIYLMEFLGSAVALTILVYVMLRWIEDETSTLAIGASILLPWSMVWLFRSELLVPLPTGLLF